MRNSNVANAWRFSDSNLQKSLEEESSFIASFVLFFVALSTLALQYQQYITSTVLYSVALFFELITTIYENMIGKEGMMALIDPEYIQVNIVSD